MTKEHVYVASAMQLPDFLAGTRNTLIQYPKPRLLTLHIRSLIMYTIQTHDCFFYFPDKFLQPDVCTDTPTLEPNVFFVLPNLDTDVGEGTQFQCPTKSLLNSIVTNATNTPIYR